MQETAEIFCSVVFFYILNQLANSPIDSRPKRIISKPAILLTIARWGCPINKKIVETAPFPRALPQPPRFAAGSSANAIPAGVSPFHPLASHSHISFRFKPPVI